ncbi:hypothetical protein BpHYR1_021193 [Brachionus plicatilis]|uniref:Uncharacterized protein n=1 Tax=Brachionus plicatilis TaxID=10195 RepID=A0A3M7TBV4_BRAPC|nr:hypothetical protein BpHYR1_021193 [Brachionus plicatilis]
MMEQKKSSFNKYLATQQPKNLLKEINSYFFEQTIYICVRQLYDLDQTDRWLKSLGQIRENLFKLKIIMIHAVFQKMKLL